MNKKLVLAACVVLLMLSGCAGQSIPEGELVDPQVAADEIVQVAAASRDAIGGEWFGVWSTRTSVCQGDVTRAQFRGIFYQSPPGDRDESERIIREVWADLGGEVVRTDRPNGSMQVLLRRSDGLLILMTVAEHRTTFSVTSACFEEDVDIDPRQYLPQTEPNVTPV